MRYFLLIIVIGWFNGAGHAALVSDKELGKLETESTKIQKFHSNLKKEAECILDKVFDGLYFENSCETHFEYCCYRATKVVWESLEELTLDPKNKAYCKGVIENLKSTEVNFLIGKESIKTALAFIILKDSNPKAARIMHSLHSKPLKKRVDFPADESGVRAYWDQFMNIYRELLEVL